MSNVPLHSRAMLCSLHQSLWQAKATDRDIATKTEKESNAERGTLSVVKALTPGYLIRPIKYLAEVGRQEHNVMTLPGLVRGQQLLAAASFDRYISIQREVKERFFEAVETFCKTYPDIVQQAPRRLGTTFKQNDFPKPDKIKGYFGYDVKFAPVPQVSNWFMDGLSDDEANQIRDQVKMEVEGMFSNATRELFERTRDSLTKLAEHAANYDQTKPALLQDRTIFHVKEIISLLPEMNILQDPTLDKIAKEMTDLLKNTEAKDIRADDALRSKIASISKSLALKIPERTE